jgi:membrane fusion protein, multidrug efflux system
MSNSVITENEKSHTTKYGMWKLLPIALLIMVSLILLGWWVWRMSEVSTENAYVVGNVTPISSEVSGPVVALYVDDNMVVKPGDPLIQIDPIPFQLEVDQALADFKQAKSEADAARFNVTLVREDRIALLDGARAKMQEKEELVKSSEIEIQTRNQIYAKEKELLEALKVNAGDYYVRFQRLAASGDIPIQDKDNKEAVFREATAKVESLKSQISSSEKQVLASGLQLQQAGVLFEQSKRSLLESKAEVAKAQAAQIQPDIAISISRSLDSKIDQAQAKLSLARLRLSNTLIRAPQSGIISKRTAQLGLTINSRSPFLSITPLDLDNVWVVANLREDQLDHTRVGQAVYVRVDAIPEKVFLCWVESISGGTGSAFSLFPPDNATGNFTRIVQRLPVRLRFFDKENMDTRIRPGMSCKIQIDTNKKVKQSETQW